MAKTAGSKGTRRKTITNPILRRQAWCLLCMRVSNRDWGKDEDDYRFPLVIQCYIDAPHSKSCARCSKAHHVCDSVPAGIEGNRFQLLAVLSWAEQFWLTTGGTLGAAVGALDKDDEEVQFLFPPEFIEAVADAVRDLVAAFDTLVRAHRRNHSLSGTHIPTSVRDNYAAFVAEHPIGDRDTRAAVHPWDILAVQASERPRLMNSEESLTAWIGAVISFQQTCSEAVELLDDPDVEAMLEERMTVFPYGDWTL
ncbi:hypothetical protein CBS147332_3089 [Penicillium roqueforti]|nr:hypothetical protein CBS147332_3089 [Penicillium roqueforti]KAI3125503.1 hypothetical protein CBS147331_497 [Penicillium roqueforti]